MKPLPAASLAKEFIVRVTSVVENSRSGNWSVKASGVWPHGIPPGQVLGWRGWPVSIEFAVQAHEAPRVSSELTVTVKGL